jgi:hypothetical protein
MDAFENVVSMLLRHAGYWTMTSVKVRLTKAEKRRIGTHTMPRWERKRDITDYLTPFAPTLSCQGCRVPLEPSLPGDCTTS